MAHIVVLCFCFFFFFKQKTAYEMRISDWSSDVCSSDIDIPNRVARFEISDAELERRRAAQAAKGWKPATPRPRKVTAALKAYAKLVTSADMGAVRNLDLLEDCDWHGTASSVAVIGSASGRERGCQYV